MGQQTPHTSSGQEGHDEEQHIEQLRIDFLNYYTLARKSSQALIEEKSLDEELLSMLAGMREKYNSLKGELELEAIRARLEVSLSFDEVLYNSGRSIRLMNGILITCIVVFGLTAFFLSRSITGPLHNLLQATNQIAGGDLSQTIAIRSGDELAFLGTAMERMRSELQQFYQKLEQLVAELAQRNKKFQREIEERKRVEERLRFTEFSVERSSIWT